MHSNRFAPAATSRCRRLIWLVTLLLACAWPRSAAEAHAYLVRSDPPTGAALALPPASILLTYTEELEPAFTRVQLLDAAGNVIVRGPGVIEPQDPRSLRLALPMLVDGVYSAVWQTRSLVDGHDAQGTVSFSVGGPEGQAGVLLAQLPAPGAPDPATAPPPPLAALRRWLNYLAAALLVGSLVFAVLVWRPSLGSQGSSLQAEADRHISTILLRIAAVGVAGVAAVSVLSALWQAVLASRPGAAWDALLVVEYLGSRAGLVLGARSGILIALAVSVSRLPLAGSPRSDGWWATLAFGLALLATFSVQSHSAARNGALGAFLDWLHLAAMCAWLGGLLPLALVLRARRDHQGIPGLSVLVPRFSRVALPCVAILAVTGVFNAVPLVQTLAALTGTTQGRALLVKTALFGILILLGTVNLLVLTPRLRRAIPAGGLHLSRTVRSELVLGLLVLLATSVVTAVAPAREALAARERQGTVRQAQVGQVQMTLRVAPGTPGGNAFGVDISDARPGVHEAPGQVLLRVSRPEYEAMGVTEIETTTRDGQRYTAAGSYLAMAGLWQVEVILRRAGLDDVRRAFEIPVEAGARPPSTTAGGGHEESH